MILIVNCGSQKTIYIEQVVNEFMDFKTVGLFDVNDLNLSDYKGIIISGAPILLSEVDTEKYLSTSSWIKTSPIPILGICFGHQLISLNFGGFVSKITPVRDWEDIGQFEDCPLLDMLPDDFEMMQDHCEVASIPLGFQLVASSDSCVNEAMQHVDKSIFGVQFHPEVSGNHGRVIFDNFVRICENKANQ